MPEPVLLFYSYSHRDEELRKELDTHLAILQRKGVIDQWHDRKIGAGEEWAGQIDANLKVADVVLLLVSSDFLASRYCYDVEMKRALERHNIGEALVIPIIVRPVDWEGAPFDKLQMLPTDAKPVTGQDWHNRDEAWLDVVRGIRAAVQRIAGTRPSVPAPSPLPSGNERGTDVSTGEREVPGEGAHNNAMFNRPARQSVTDSGGHTQTADVVSQGQVALAGARAASGVTSAQGHVADALEALWDSVLQVQNLSFRFLHFYQYIFPDEYPTIFTNPKAAGLLPGPQGNDLLAQLGELRGRVEVKRPLIGERLWSLYSAYHRFAWRSSWKVQEGWQNHRLQEWHKDLDGNLDQASLSLLRGALAQEEVDTALLLTKGASSGASLGTLQYVLTVIETKMLDLVREALGTDRDRPLLCPAGTIPLVEDRYIDWSQSTWKLDLRNVGTGMADLICGILLGPQTPTASLSDRYYLWRQSLLRPDESRTITMQRGGLMLSGHTLFGLHALYAPPTPSFTELQAGAPYIIARLTLTYQDSGGSKHASIFDYHMLHGWQRVTFLRGIPDDLEDLDRRARQRYSR